MNKQNKDPTFSEKYCRAVMERKVPPSILYNNMMDCEGKPLEVQRAMKDQFAEEILK